MKTLYLTLSLCLLLLTRLTASAQDDFSISGKVTDENNTPLKSATVFISGSQKITICDDQGSFRFDHLDAGNYQLTVTMIGYFAYSQPASVTGKSTNINIKLKTKQTVLKQVNIGKDNFDARFKTFREAFLGKTKNANDCIIVNPHVINFSTEKGLLLADADDFLIIENPNLGYRIKYLLKNFGYNAKTDVTLYDGETSFEPMKGTAKMQKKWDKNRLEAYRGSFMHFLRSVYQNTVLKEGFVINYIFGPHPIGSLCIYDDRAVGFDSLVRTIDTSFVAFKFEKLLFTYDPLKARSAEVDIARYPRSVATPIVKMRTVGPWMTIISLHANEAIIDRRGAHRDFRDFLIEGDLAKYRVGDQLPFEYQPPAKN
ncbi:carboxypeptidase-like regulatory domain-containing protein [Mucilaginibacter ximonensis]|uniref:Carboxypeptidase-like regulatory domain-containing protein n=1 Tax=Mucilaginibacter ximonensis TaxID=538021 RepID=A0ABW5YDT5_9SPHI